MATPKKLKSGRWRAQVYLGKRDGKNIYGSVTADTKAECAFKAAQLKEHGIPEEAEKMTVGEAIDAYIASCATLSPTTIAGYKKIRRNYFPALMDEPISGLNAVCLQKAINAEIRRETERRHNLSAKSIRNAWGLVAASLRYVSGLTYNVKLPKDDPKFLELPDPAVVMAAVRGSDIELACILALWLSLSMSEVRGLKYSSIRHGCIYIDQVVVDVDGQPVEKKRAKVASRNRVLNLPPYIMQLIREKTAYNDYEAGRISDDYLCPFREWTIRRHLDRLLPGMSFHQLRHLNASVMLQLGVPDKYAMERGGWSTPDVMKRVYQHTFSDARKTFDRSIDDYFMGKISHESIHENR